jgi:hypothetical protein
MSRVIAVLACGLALAACTMSMPSLDVFKSTPTTETLRVESEPPGADARTSQGQTCRTPCELSVSAGGEMTVSFALNGYQPQSIQVRTEQSPGGGSNFEARLQPNPVYAELQSITPQRPGKNAPSAKKRTTTAKRPPPPPESSAASPAGGYPWPPPPQ